MAQAIISSTVLLTELPSGIVPMLKRELTFVNPAYVSAKKNNRYIPASLPEYLHYYDFMPELDKERSLIIPRGFMNRALSIMQGVPLQINDKTVRPAFEIQFTGNLREYQNSAIKDVLKYRYGVLEAPTGSGKTVCGIATLAARKTTTLIIVHNTELLNQWKEALLKFTNIKESDIGFIGNGHFNVKPVTIGIINSVTKQVRDIYDKFGFVIYDESHRAAARTWITVINGMKPYFQLGLSATPFRGDGLTKLLFSLIGPKLHQIDRKQLEEISAIMVPKIIKVKTDFRYQFKQDYSDMLTTLSTDSSRNRLIAGQIISDYRAHQEPIMVVSDRISHCADIESILNSYSKELSTLVLSSQIPKKQRRQGVEDLRKGKYNVLIATLSLLGEGFDAPDLNALFLTTPVKFSGRLIQSVGRVLRPSNGKPPRVYDFRDSFVGVLANSGWARDRVYISLGWPGASST